jgi:hypothetical protein
MTTRIADEHAEIAARMREIAVAEGRSLYDIQSVSKGKRSVVRVIAFSDRELNDLAAVHAVKYFNCDEIRNSEYWQGTEDADADLSYFGGFDRVVAVLQWLNGNDTATTLRYANRKYQYSRTSGNNMTVFARMKLIGMLE